LAVTSSALSNFFPQRHRIINRRRERAGFRVAAYAGESLCGEAHVSFLAIFISSRVEIAIFSAQRRIFSFSFTFCGGDFR
jgi:hypothetical protein